MPATRSTADRFYAIFRPLLFYVNAQLNLVSGVRSADETTRLPVAEVNKIRQALWHDNSLRGDFIQENSANLSSADLMIVASWNERRTGKFFIFRHLKTHSIFIDDRSPAKIYAVHGLYSPIAEVVSPYLPILVEAVLLPFEDQIIYDGIVAPYNITFGSGIRGDLNDLYRDAKEREAIITSLIASAGPLSREDRSATARAVNAKVMREFRTYLYRSGLSAKVVERDVSAVEEFATVHQPRSLRDLHAADLLRYMITASPTTRTGFKRFCKFMADTARMDWGEADEVLRWLRQAK